MLSTFYTFTTISPTTLFENKVGELCKFPFNSKLNWDSFEILLGIVRIMRTLVKEIKGLFLSISWEEISIQNFIGSNDHYTYNMTLIWTPEITNALVLWLVVPCGMIFKNVFPKINWRTYSCINAWFRK